MMDAAVNSPDQRLVCETCGDKGFTNAFVYCVKCLGFAIHRYCLKVIPKTPNERVIWYCEDCQVKLSLTQEKEAANLGQIKANAQNAPRDVNGSFTTGTKEFNFHNIPKRKRTNRKKVAASLAANKTGNKIQQRKIGFLKDCSLLACMLSEWKLLDEPQPSSSLCDLEELVSEYSPTDNESDKADSHECQPETGSGISETVDSEKNLQDNYYRYAQPVIDPIWSGSFNVIGTTYGQFEGFAAHISTKACYKVFQEASIMTSSLYLEMHPRTVLWPKSFQECEPSDHIALYFLPGNPINVKAYDNLVLDMMDNGLAMKATTKNAELLIFTSLCLPPFFRRLQEKYYLWGVFRGKQNDPISLTSHDLSKDSPNERAAVKQSVTMMKTFNTHSPRSHLSNNAKQRRRIAASGAANKKGNKIQQRKIGFLKDCNLLAHLLNEWKSLDECQPSIPSRDESDKADSHECQTESGSGLSQSLEFEKNMQDNYYGHAQPVIDPIWRGTFSVLGRNFGQFEGFAAHLSNKACYKVFKEAGTLTSSLYLEMHPKTVLWPKSFQERDPSDDDIALYFLPGNAINAKAYDDMILDMIDNGLAMKATTKNVELLIFTSVSLPPLFRRFQEKYYLWGVFRHDLTSLESHDLSKDSPNELVDVEQSETMMKTLDTYSPRSHLRVDDIVEPFVECMDKAMDQPIVYERSEDNNDCDFVNTEESEHIHIHRFFRTVKPRIPRAPQDVPEAEWIHPRLSQHHHLVQRTLFMQKLSPSSPFIIEKLIKKDVSIGDAISECFMRIGWSGVLALEPDEVYPEAVIEWMSTLQRTWSAIGNMELTGEVNGKKATLDMKFIRETYGVDTGVIEHPEAQYEHLAEKTLCGKQWRIMTDAIFTTVDEGTLTENLTPLANALWRIGMRNIHPRVGREMEVCRHEVPIIYGLATGNIALSYAHLVIMNIWRAYELKEMSYIPHAYLISSFLKLKNVVGINMVPKKIQENSSFK